MMPIWMVIILPAFMLYPSQLDHVLLDSEGVVLADAALEAAAGAAQGELIRQGGVKEHVGDDVISADMVELFDQLHVQHAALFHTLITTECPIRTC